MPLKPALKFSYHRHILQANKKYVYEFLMFTYFKRKLKFYGFFMCVRQKISIILPFLLPFSVFYRLKFFREREKTVFNTTCHEIF